MHFMEPFNNMKGIHACQLVCIFNKRTIAPSGVIHGVRIQAAGAQKGGWANRRSPEPKLCSCFPLMVETLILEKSGF